MNTLPLILLPLLASVPLTAEPAQDFLRFKNGDTLHGRYQGLDEGPLVEWLSDESVDPIHFETQNLRKLSLNNGRARNNLVSPGLVILNNGDRLLGSLVSMGKESVTVQTEFAGLLTIPRESVERISPNRHGGGVVYAGPFNDQDWSVPGEQITAEKEEITEEQEAAEDEESEESEIPKLKKSWVHGNAAWYNNSTKTLRLDTPLPSQVSIRFKLAWQPPLNASIAIFSDFQRPFRNPKPRVRRVEEKPPEGEVQEEEAEAAEEPVEEKPPEFVDIMQEGEGPSDADSFGSGYLISLLSSYSKLHRLGFDDKLKAKKSSFSTAGGRLNLGDIFSAEFEIRANREEGKVTLFINGEFYSEWHDLAEPLGEADRYFAIAAGSKSRIRVSDVVISEWNGMPDSARSMQTKERDVLLLTNGTDRFSGDILGLEEDVYRVKSDYATFEIPANEVAEIQLATDFVAEPIEPENGEVKVSFQPDGLLTFSPQQGKSNSLQGTHPILGDLSLDLNYAYLLEFDPIGSIFDNWDDDF